MGEAKINKSYKSAFLREHPYCCYCGGNTPATTIDHIPSRQLFRYRKRPKGLELPSCESCNRNSGGHEQVAAMLSRIYPDPPDKIEMVEFEKILKGVNRWNPQLIPEIMGTSWVQQYDFEHDKHKLPEGVSVLNVKGPLLNASMQIFGAKVVFALHYYTTGNIIPETGCVAVRWFSNYERMTGKFPEEIMKHFPDMQTLEQGDFNVSDQFGYSYQHTTDNSNIGMYFAYFRQSFSFIGFAYHDCKKVPEIDGIRRIYPGFAKTKPFSL